MKLQWNVFVENVNRQVIETYNIFDHRGFLDSCLEAAKKCRGDRAAFRTIVTTELQYWFWSKCEWEIVLDAWPQYEKFHPKKVDVYGQVMLNRDIFLRYLEAELLKNERGDL